jgi:hypothetical protein
MGIRSSNPLASYFDYGMRSGRDIGPLFYPLMSGGIEIDEGSHVLHVFTSTGNLVVNTPVNIDYLVVGGGGGSASAYGGGGGGGGVRTGTYVIPSGTHLITVGAGGTSSPTADPAPYKGVGYPGQPSSMGSFIISAGGGAGGGSDNFNGQPPDPAAAPLYINGSAGASGGGGGAYTLVGTAGTGISGQGYPGANAVSTQRGGGGGGAGERGGKSPTYSPQRQGGDGIAIPWVPPAYGTVGPTPGRWFGGGGSGGTHVDPTQGFPDGLTLEGGAGGGGRGVNASYPVPPVEGMANTGGGAGGGGGNSWGQPPAFALGNGGSGIVIVRYSK